MVWTTGTLFALFLLLRGGVPWELSTEPSAYYRNPPEDPDTGPFPTTLPILNTTSFNDTEEYREFEKIFRESLEFDLPGSNCTPSFIDEFPPDPFTLAQRRRGFVVFHCLVCCYVFYAFAIVCGDYFVPSVENMAQDLKLESDIAGATIMGIATSSPELFTSVVGTFIMRGDIGVGTVVGSAVFNHLAVCAFIGFGCSQVVALDWWPVTRDLVFYAMSVVALFVILLDCKIYWYESFVLILLYILYILGIYNDAQLHAWTESLLQWEPHFTFNGHRGKYRVKQPARRKSLRIMGMSEQNSASTATIITISDELLDFHKTASPPPLGETSKKTSKCSESRSRTGRAFTAFEKVIAWPIRSALSLTIPDCRRENGRRMWYGVTFIMSTLWIAMLSYVAAWMMTITAHTFRIPDTVFGVSIIAAGTSVPEAVSSVMVARKGYGTMAVSNAVGSNTFNILVCLGVPWLIQGLININLRNNYAEITSLALEYSTGLTLLSLLIMYGLLIWNRFRIDKRVATVAIIVYLVFLLFDVLVEMNVLFFVNLPIC